MTSGCTFSQIDWSVPEFAGIEIVTLMVPPALPLVAVMTWGKALRPIPDTAGRAYPSDHFAGRHEP